MSDYWVVEQQHLFSCVLSRLVQTGMHMAAAEALPGAGAEACPLNPSDSRYCIPSITTAIIIPWKG
jgi:hypothetical protein